MINRTEFLRRLEASKLPRAEFEAIRDTLIKMGCPANGAIDREAAAGVAVEADCDPSEIVKLAGL